MTKIQNINQLQQIRLAPDSYGGDVSIPNHMLQEALDNAIDQALLGKADHIWIGIHADGSASITDNGDGIPFSVATTVTGEKIPTARMAWTVPNTSSHYGQTATTSIGKNGIGMKFTTATAEWFIGEAWYDNKHYKDEYHLKESSEPHEVPFEYITPLNSKHTIDPDDEPAPFGIEHGTRVRFYPDTTIYRSIVFDTNDLYDKLHQQAFLNAGLKLTYINEYKNEAITFYEPDGLKAYITDIKSKNQPTTKFITDTHIIKQRIVIDEHKYYEAQIAFAYTNSDDTVIESFVNSVKTPDDGTHVSSFKSNLTKLLSGYYLSLNLGNDKDKPTNKDLTTGLIAVVLAFYTNPLYSGQTKDKLTSPEATTCTKTIMEQAGALELDRSIPDVEAIIKQAIAHAKLRKQYENLTIPKDLNKRGKALADSKLEPARKIGPTVNAELFINEGLSASGSSIRRRINNTKLNLFQAILPLRGKVINAIKNTPDKVFENAEIAALVATLGCGVGKNCDPDKCNYRKIIIMTDADVDGEHIELLLLNFFMVYMRPLVEKGMVYINRTPLFINELKTKEVYTWSQDEQNEFLKTHQPKSVTRNKGLGELGDDRTELFLTPGTRRLYQLETADFETSYELLKLFESGEVAPRRKYIEQHARYANREMLA